MCATSDSSNALLAVAVVDEAGAVLLQARERRAGAGPGRGGPGVGGRRARPFLRSALFPPTLRSGALCNRPPPLNPDRFAQTPAPQPPQKKPQELVKPEGEVLDLRTHITGVTPSDLGRAKLRRKDVAARVAELLGPDTILVGHSLAGDLAALKVGLAPCSILIALRGAARQHECFWGSLGRGAWGRRGSARARACFSAQV
jgi:hypothetical protein